MSKLTEKMMKMESFKSRVPATKEQIGLLMTKTERMEGGESNE